MLKMTAAPWVAFVLLGFAPVIALIATGQPAASQDSSQPTALQKLEADVLEKVRQGEIETDRYMKSHPLHSDLLFGSTLRFVRVLGKFEESSEIECATHPDFPDWGDLANSLHQNTHIALDRSYMAGRVEARDALNPEQRADLAGSPLCFEDMSHVFSELKELPSLFAALKRHDY